MIAVGMAVRHPGVVRSVMALSSTYALEGMQPELVKPQRDPTAFVARLGKILAEWKGCTQADFNAMRAPVLLPIGDNDFVRVEHAAEMARMMPDSQLAALPGTTHMSILQCGAWLEPMVEARLATGERPRTEGETP
jgi:hypothetical protein